MKVKVKLSEKKYLGRCSFCNSLVLKGTGEFFYEGKLKFVIHSECKEQLELLHWTE